MRVTTAKRQYNLKHWAPLIKECKNSGLTAKEWCRSNDVDPQKFYYWQRQLTEKIASSLVTTTQAKPISQGFVELPIPSQEPKSTSADIVITTETTTLEIKNSADMHLVAEILKVLTHA